MSHGKSCETKPTSQHRSLVGSDMRDHSCLCEEQGFADAAVAARAWPKKSFSDPVGRKNATLLISFAELLHTSEARERERKRGGDPYSACREKKLTRRPIRPAERQKQLQVHRATCALSSRLPKARRKFTLSCEVVGTFRVIIREILERKRAC